MAIIILTIIGIIGAGLYLLRSGAVGKLGSLTSGLIHTSSTPAAPQGAVSQTSTAVQSNPWYGSYSPPVASTPWYEMFSALSSGTSAINSADIPAGFTASQLSPYFHKVRLSSVSAGSSYSIGQISLYASFSDNAAVNVTGWTIRAHYGGEIVPQAVNFYEPSGLAAESDIILRSGDYVNIYSSASAIGENLRLNKCTGYLENNNHFTPSLPQDCPSIDRSDIRGFSGACQNYISSLYGCRLPDPNPPVPQNDYGCLSYLTTINFKGCYDRHTGDSNFLSHEWRVWTNYRFLDQYHDQLLLLDKNGLLVDVYQY